MAGIVVADVTAAYQVSLQFVPVVDWNASLTCAGLTAPPLYLTLPRYRSGSWIACAE